MLDKLDPNDFDQLFGRFHWAGEEKNDGKTFYSGVLHKASNMFKEFPYKIKVAHDETVWRVGSEESGPAKAKFVGNRSSYGAKVQAEACGMLPISQWFDKSTFEPVICLFPFLI